MLQTIVNFFSSFPPEIAAFILSTLPVVERAALPIAIAAFHLPPWEAFVLTVAGNMVPITLILLLADWFHKWVSEHGGFFGRAWVKSLKHAQDKFARYQKYELWGLLIFMALPLPINGGYTAALIAFILGVPFKRTMPYLAGGVIIAALIALGVTVGAVKVF